MLDKTLVISVVFSEEPLTVGNLAHHRSNETTHIHGSTTAIMVNPSSATPSASVGTSSEIQRAAISFDRVVPFTTTFTSMSAETFTATSGGSTFISTSTVPVLVTSTGASTLLPTVTETAVSASSASPSFDAAKVGTIVAAVAVPLLAVGICIWLFVRRRRRRSRSRVEKSQKQLEESIHPVTLLGPAHVPDIKKNDMDIILAPNSEEPAQLTSNPFETPAEQLAKLSNSVTRTPSQNTERHMMLQTEIQNVRSQMAALQYSNQEMRDTMARMMEHMRRLEADMAAEERSEFSDAHPPTYVSS